MCEFSAYVAFNKATNGHTDIKHENEKKKNLAECHSQLKSFLLLRKRSSLEKWFDLSKLDLCEGGSLRNTISECPVKIKHLHRQRVTYAACTRLLLFPWILQCLVIIRVTIIYSSCTPSLVLHDVYSGASRYHYVSIELLVVVTTICLDRTIFDSTTCL